MPATGKGIDEPLIIFTADSGVTTGINVFQFSGSTIVQPTPYVSLSRENIHYGGRWVDQDTITLDGQLTGYLCHEGYLPGGPTNLGSNFANLHRWKDDLIQKFQSNQFGSFSVIEDNKTIYAAHNCKVESINFEESAYNNILDYKITLTSFGTGNNFSDFRPESSYGGSIIGQIGVPKLEPDVIDPVDKWSFSEDKGRVKMNHEVSAKGIFGAGAIENARIWVHNRTGLDSPNNSYVAPTFVINTGNWFCAPNPAPVLMGRRERSNVTEATYGITENYEFDRDTPMHDSAPCNCPPLMSVSCKTQSGIDQDFTTVNLTIEVKGGWKGIQGWDPENPDSCVAGGGGWSNRKYGNKGLLSLPGWTSNRTILSDYVTGVIGHDLVDEARSLSNVPDLWAMPVGFSVEDNDASNTITLNISYDDNRLWGNPNPATTTISDINAWDDSSLDLSISSNYAYYDYAITMDRDIIKNKINYTIAGEIVARGGKRHRYTNAMNFFEDVMTPNITGYLHGLVRVHHEAHPADGMPFTYGCPANCIRIDGPESVSVDKNAIEGRITVRATFTNKPEADLIVTALNSKVSDYIEDISWNWDVTPGLPHYTPHASNSIGGLYLIYDANITKRVKVQFNLECRGSPCVSYENSIATAESYLNHLMGYHIDQKSWIDKSIKINKNETTRAIGITIAGTCKPFGLTPHYVITKSETKIIGKYIN